MPIGLIWQTFLETPLINFMVLLTVISFGSYGAAILLFTGITRVITFPLTMRTMRSTKAMQDLQPRMQELQKKYSDPRRRSEETMKLYREAGVNPIGCLGSQLLQFPLFIAMYQVIRITLASAPEGALYLESRLYDGGTMLYLGLGTGLGTALVVDGVPVALEVAHLRYKKGLSFENWVGRHGLERLRRKRWRKAVFDITERLRLAMVADYVVIGGGNATELKKLSPNCRLGDNCNTLIGRFRLWDEHQG